MGERWVLQLLLRGLSCEEQAAGSAALGSVRAAGVPAASAFYPVSSLVFLQTH